MTKQSLGIQLQDWIGLDWLDLKETAHTTYNDVLRATRHDLDYLGFRYATAKEIETMFTAAGILEHGWTEANYLPTKNLLASWGTTNTARTWSKFVTSEKGTPGYHKAGYMNAKYDDDTATWIGVALTESGGIHDRLAYTYAGSALVRSSPVPEPATMILLGTGLAGLAGTRIRRKKKG